MPDVSTLAIVGGAWLMLLALVWALCVAAARGDRQDGAGRDREQQQEPAEPRHERRAVIADTGGIRAHLRAASGLIEADQLKVTVDVDGTQAVLATSRAVVEAHRGDWLELTIPVGRAGAMLTAVRRPGSEPFDDADRLVLRAVAARVAGALQTTHPSSEVASERRNAMA